jgi:2Fe-2S ferredoxin
VPKVIYVAGDGSQRTVEAIVGDTLMSTAVRHGVEGIVAECGGNCSCATCHVYVRDEYLSLVGQPNGLEDDLLDLAVTSRRPGSRLSCQIKVTGQMEGLTVDLPTEQP